MEALTRKPSQKAVGRVLDSPRGVTWWDGTGTWPRRVAAELVVQRELRLGVGSRLSGLPWSFFSVRVALSPGGPCATRSILLRCTGSAVFPTRAHPAVPDERNCEQCPPPHTY